MIATLFDEQDVTARLRELRAHDRSAGSRAHHDDLGIEGLIVAVVSVREKAHGGTTGR
jgi:hypothetical protein